MPNSEWQLKIANANLVQLREWAQMPATYFPRGTKAAVLRELQLREANLTCRKCHRKVGATLNGLCGACLRFGAEPQGDYCCECGEWVSGGGLIGGRCGSCHLNTVGHDDRFIRAGEELPAAEVFTKDEIARMDFVKHLIASGKLGN